MTTASQTPTEFPRVIAVVGASSTFGALMLRHLETALPHCRLVAIDAYPLRRPVKQVSAYRMEPNRAAGAILTIDDIPEMMQQRAWDMVVDNRRPTMADVPDVFHLESVDSVIHVGSHYDRANPREFLEGTQHWAQASRLAGCVQQFVYVSDVRVYGAGADNPVPLTERSQTEPAPAHQFILDAESDLQNNYMQSTTDAGMRVAVLRSAMSVGPTGSSPAADELLWSTLASGRNGNVPLQLVHQHDLTRAVQIALTRRLDDVYNVAGSGVLGARTMRDLCKSAMAKHPRYRARRRSPSRSRHLARRPLIVSDTKLKQAVGFKAKYSSEQAARAYCHSYLLEPSTRHDEHSTP